MSFCFGGICGSSSAVSTPTSTAPNSISYYTNHTLNKRLAEARRRRAANKARRDEMRIAQEEVKRQKTMSKSSYPSILKGKKILELLLNEDNKKLDAKRNENKVALRALEDEILALIPGATLDVYNYTKKNEYGNPLKRVSYLKQAQSNNGPQYGTEPIPAFRTILMYAAAYNFTRVVRELIRQNPELLNRRNDEETPALVYACLSKSTESALILIANGEHLDDVSPTDSSFCYKDPIISSVLKSSDPRAAAIEELTRLKLFNGRSMGGRTRKNARARRNKTRNQRRRI